MKKIANVSQTYGDERSIEIDFFLSEQNIKILNKLDIITFSFHNCSNKFKIINTNKILDKIPNCIIYYFDNMTYVESIIQYLNNLKKLGITDYLLWQDDHYMNEDENSEKIFTELLNYYKTHDEIYNLNLFFDTFYSINSYKDFKPNKIYNVKNQLNIYEYNTLGMDLNMNDDWFVFAYTDENHILNIDVALEHFFIEEYKDLDVWKLERELSLKANLLDLKKCFTNAILFFRRTLHSKNTYSNNDIHPKVLENVIRQENTDVHNINKNLL